MKAPLHLWHRTSPDEDLPAYVSQDTATFHGYLPRDIAAFFWLTSVPVLLLKLGAGEKLWWVFRFGWCKTSCGCTLKRRWSTCRTIHCPQMPHRLLKRFRAFCSSQIIYTSIRPAPQTVSQNHRNRHIRKLPYPWSLPEKCCMSCETYAGKLKSPGEVLAARRKCEIMTEIRAQLLWRFCV